MSRPAFIATLIASSSAAAILAALAAVNGATVAHGHEMVPGTGVHYDPWCCDGRDCRQIACSEVRYGEEGVRFPGSAEILPWSDLDRQPTVGVRLRFTPAEAGATCHVCSVPEEGGGSYIRCGYIPQLGG